MQTPVIFLLLIMQTPFVKGFSESSASIQVIELCMWGFGCHWGGRAIDTIELMARSTGDEEGGAKEPARARRAWKPPPTVMPWREVGAVHWGEVREAWAVQEENSHLKSLYGVSQRKECF